MKDKKKLIIIIISSVLAVLLAIAIFSFFSDKNKLNKKEKTWIANNLTTVQNIGIVNNINVFGNIIIFIPFGLFISSYLKSKKVFSVFFISLITSAFIELVQLKVGRSFDIDDIILNVIGSVIGYLLYLGLKSLKKKLPSCLKKDFVYNIISLLIFAGIIYWLICRIGII